MADAGVLGIDRFATGFLECIHHFPTVTGGDHRILFAMKYPDGQVHDLLGLSRLAMFSSLRIKQQEEVVAAEHWLHSFDDLIIEELFLGEDKQLLE